MYKYYVNNNCHCTTKKKFVSVINVMFLFLLRFMFYEVFLVSTGHLSLVSPPVFGFDDEKNDLHGHSVEFGSLHVASDAAG